MSANNESLAGGPQSPARAIQAPRCVGSGSSTVAGGRARLTATLSLGILLTTLIIDGFPPGIDVLHEFGARLTNFLLILSGLGLLVYGRVRTRPLSLSLQDSVLWIVVLLIVPATNLPVAVLQAGAGASVLTDWVKQYLMFFWGVLSFFIWRGTLAEFDARRYSAIATVTALVPVVLFFLEFADSSNAITTMLGLFRRKFDIRPSGLATEPSIYAAWISVIWPLVFYRARNARRALRRAAAAVVLGLLVISAYLSNARTFAVVMVLQLIYVSYWSVQRRQSWRSRIRSFLIILCVAAGIVVVLLSSLLSVVHVSGNQSDIARFAYTITGINVSLAHPLVGVGIGQFSSFFAQYAPQFAAVSGEVMTHINGAAVYRASTFNLFVRLFVEFGIPLGLVFSVIIVRPIVRAPKSPVRDPFLIYAALSAIGGVGFWLSQDQYGYQPGILSLAVLSLVLEGAMRTANEGGASPAAAPAVGDIV